MRIQVDEHRCEGHGMCEEAAPELFVLDDEGMVQVARLDIGEDRRRAAEAGVRACPVAALLLVSD